MGWARTLLLGDIGNRLDIADAEADVSSLYGELESTRQLDRSQDRSIRQLQDETAQLEVCVAALLRALRQKKILTTSELVKLADMLESSPERDP